MKRQLRVVLLVASVACGLSKASADESFLNQELPTTWVIYRSDMDLLQVLKSVVPKAFILPEGMSVPAGLPEPKPATVPTAPEWGKDGALFGRIPGDKTPFTVRDYLNEAVKFMGLTWSYDAGRDAVVLDFPWHVNDPRSNAELMETLAKTVPPEDEKHVYRSTVDMKADPWRVAFNALLSKPENYPKAWQVRWKADAASDYLLPGFKQPIDLFTGKILDEIGAAHFIILNIQPPVAVPGESTVSYYLFSGTGKLEQGGVFYANNRWAKSCNAEVEANETHLIIHNDRFDSSQEDQVFTVEKNCLVYKEHLTNGKPMPPENSFKYLFEVHAD